eukprot:5577396-Heterocapsa_arctica.AAC.1
MSRSSPSPSPSAGRAPPTSPTPGLGAAGDTETCPPGPRPLEASSEGFHSLGTHRKDMRMPQASKY